MARSTPANQAENDTEKATTATLGHLKYEAALAELEQIVQSMEGGRLPLEESIAAYRRGSELLKHCQQQLGDAESKIQILENGVLRDFDVSAGGSR